jgi:hypothetical protein
MFRPWRPIEFDIRCHPELRYEVEGRTLRVHLFQFAGPKFELDIHFDECVAGLIVVDESVYQSSSIVGLPGPSDFDDGGFSPIPWPMWKEMATPRVSLYGDLGRVTYKSMDSYYIVGCDTVVLLDVADGEPRISVREPNNSLGRTRGG